ncbi:MAG: hypothetical protein QXR32_05635, partial [Candidatus Caldarchaeum sp.]
VGLRVVKISPLKRVVTVVPESTLDLLNLYRVVETGDMVYAVTSREVKKQRGDGSVDSERVRLEIGVEILRKELEPFTRRLNLHGVIRYEGRELGLVGKHHSIHLEVGDEITLESRKNYPQLESMASYYRDVSTQKPATVVMVDDEGLSVYVAMQTGLKLVYRKDVSAGKEEPEDRSKAVAKAYGEAVEKIADADSLYIFGPSVMVDEFIKYVKRERKELAARIKKTGYVSSTDSAGVSELLRNKSLHELREAVKTIADMEEVEEFMALLVKEPSRTALGLKETIAALSMKAVEKMLIAEDFLWNSIADKNVEQLLDMAESSKTLVRVISSGSEACEKLMSLGGLACVLRFAVEPSLLREAG